MHGTVQSYFRWSWRRAVVASILGRWLAVGLAWGARAALLFTFPFFVGCAYAIGGVLAGRLTYRAGRGYYFRQLDADRTGHWRDRHHNRGI